jgi:hypothetical protein
VPKPKPSTIKLQVFKGREAKLNKAVFSIFASRGPHTVSALLKEIKKQRDLKDTRDSVLRRRLEALEKQDYLIKVGAVKTRWGYDTLLYSLTPKAELAIILSRTDMNNFIKEASYHQLISMIDVFKSYLRALPAECHYTH